MNKILSLFYLSVVLASSSKECVKKCGGEVNCLASCMNLPNPSEDQVNATTDCNSKCSVAGANQNDCFNSCVKDNFNKNDIKSASAVTSVSSPTSMSEMSMVVSESMSASASISVMASSLTEISAMSSSKYQSFGASMSSMVTITALPSTGMSAVKKPKYKSSQIATPQEPMLNNAGTAPIYLVYLIASTLISVIN